MSKDDNHLLSYSVTRLVTAFYKATKKIKLSANYNRRDNKIFVVDFGPYQYLHRFFCLFSIPYTLATYI